MTRLQKVEMRIGEALRYPDFKQFNRPGVILYLAWHVRISMKLLKLFGRRDQAEWLFIKHLKVK